MQQLIDRGAGLQGIDEQQAIDCRAISGPKQPPNVAKRKANSNTMGLALLITQHITTRSSICFCDNNHSPSQISEEFKLRGVYRALVCNGRSSGEGFVSGGNLKHSTLSNKQKQRWRKQRHVHQDSKPVNGKSLAFVPDRTEG